MRDIFETKLKGCTTLEAKKSFVGFGIFLGEIRK